ncbi:hypothetical protein ES705_23475 [subsurface metagenome]
MYELFLAYFENSTGMEFDFLSGAGMKAVIQNVTDEIYPFMPGVNASGCFFDFYISYAANNWTLQTEAANETSPMVYFVDPSALNESTIMYSMSGIPIFMSKGFNYAMFVSEYQSIIASNPYTSGNITITEQGNGFKIVYKAAILEYLFESLGTPIEIGTLKDAEITLRWNSNGVFDKGSLVYGGLELATAYLETDDEFFIPGYELVTILGVSLVTFIALVYTIKKKKILK